MYWQTTPEYRGLPYSMVDIPSVTPVKKMDFTSASSYLGRGGRLCLLLFLHAGILCRSCAWGDSLCEFICVSTLMYLEMLFKSSLWALDPLNLYIDSGGCGKASPLGLNAPKSLAPNTPPLNSS